MARWASVIGPYRGTRVVVDHNMWVYFLTRFGLVQAGAIEERPGIPPAPGHLAKLIAIIKDERLKVILTAPWTDQKLAERIAQEAGAKVVLMASGVGAVKGTDSYLDMIDYNVKAVAQALR
jgi:zinc/manganese transport system substrate-binding protein